MELLGHFVWDVIKGLALSVPRAIHNYKFSKFFGQQAIKSDRVFIVLDPYEHPLPRPNQRYVKNFYGRRPNQTLAGEDKVLGSCSVRITKYASSEFALFRNKTNPVKIVLDEEVTDSWEGTFVCFGSSDSNIKTFDIERLVQNNLYSFPFDNNRNRCFEIDGQRYSIQGNMDAAVLMGLQNPWHRDHKLFVCAGLGEWGTSGAAYYLFKNWRQLHNKFGAQKNFVLMLRVNINSDE